MLTAVIALLAVQEVSARPALEGRNEAQPPMQMMMSPDSQPPLGVTGGMQPLRGRVMLSAVFGDMKMKGYRNGSSEVANSQVLDEFPVAPTEMVRNMYLISAMYGATEKLSVMGAIPYSRAMMDHITRAGVRFSTQSEGIGDVRIIGFYLPRQPLGHLLQLGIGASLPTGSVDERDDTPSGPKQVLPKDSRSKVGKSLRPRLAPGPLRGGAARPPRRDLRGDL